MRDNDLDSAKDWFGSKRIFHADDGWYVGTRNGDLGPLPHRRLAVIKLQRYIKELKCRKIF